jgi:hypothetical protein
MMRRALVILAGCAVVVLLIAGLSVGLITGPGGHLALAQPATATPAATAGPGSRHPLPPELAFLRSMTPDQRFDHILGGQITFRNPQGQDVVLTAIPGKIASIGTNAVTITPNGSAQDRTFNVTPSTWIITGPRQGSLAAFSQGDRVVVLTINNSSNATAIMRPHLMWMTMDGMSGL